MALGVAGVRVGISTDLENLTGCTVVLPPPGSVGGMAIRGGAPGTREAGVLSVGAANTMIHGVALCGSSLFGLRAAEGVVDWCVENEIGLSLPGGIFPIIGAAVVMDVRSPTERRIDASDGRKAAGAASEEDPAQGNVGVGVGCTVGKEAGPEFGSKGGQGWAVETSGSLTVGALMAVNAFGSIYDEHGQMLAGCRADPGVGRYPHVALENLYSLGPSEGPSTNTVIGVVATNAAMTKSQACRVADLAHSGIARSVQPAHSDLDGDAIFAIGTGEVEASTDLIAHLASLAVAGAIRSAVRHAESVPGFPKDERSKS
jgi:L-aminopeptidase/D-esterase-like protein